MSSKKSTEKSQYSSPKEENKTIDMVQAMCNKIFLAATVCKVFGSMPSLRDPLKSLDNIQLLKFSYELCDMACESTDKNTYYEEKTNELIKTVLDLNKKRSIFLLSLMKKGGICPDVVKKEILESTKFFDNVNEKFLSTSFKVIILLEISLVFNSIQLLLQFLSKVICVPPV